MTDTPLDTYIKSPPPADERSHFNYLEEQFTKLENVSKKHVVRIGDNDATAKALVLQEATSRVSGDEAQAQYTQTVAAQTLSSATALVTAETTARTTADSALASQITTLNASVGTLSGNITSEASLRLTADEALGTRIDNLVLSSGSSAAVIIDSEASARVAADYALGVRIDNLTTVVDTNTASISTEQTARSTRDDALAKQLFTMSSGSSRVYISTTAPGSTGRQAGDVWFDSSTSNNYKPYVWAQIGGTGAYDWRDNSAGTYTNNVGNYAVYTQNIQTLTTTTSSLSSSVTALQSTVGNSSAGLVRDVSALTTTVGNSSSGLVKDVTTLQSTTAAQRIFRQATQPSTAIADRKIGDLWYDTANNNTPYFWDGTAWQPNPDNTRATTAALTTETSARTSADTALASYLMSASAGTGRVYTSDPGAIGRLDGDVWLRTDQNLKPYVWYTGAWQDNSAGAYTQYVGHIANITTTANAAYTTANNANGLATTTASTVTTLQATVSNNYTTLSGQISTEASTRASADSALSTSLNTVSSTVNGNTASISTLQTTTANINDTLSNQWAIVGTLGGPSNNIVSLTGIRKADGTPASYALDINANVTINGDLLVNGTVNGAKIIDGAVGNPKIANNAVSNNGFAESGATPSVTLTCRAGARMVILVTHGGGGAYSFNPNGTVTAYVNNTSVGSQSVFGCLYSIAVALGPYSTVNWSGGWTVPATTLLCLYTIPSDGSYTFAANSNLSGNIKLLVTELAK